MERRRFLHLLGGTAPALLGTRAWAQAPAARAATTGVPGVTTTEIRVGMSAAFKKTAAGLGTELYRGAQAYYEDVNARGGINGRNLSVVALDDSYERSEERRVGKECR